jgi:cardiolipin synthase
MNVPNILTFSRILLAPVIVILLIQASFFKALIVFIVAGITDGLDGFLARVLQQKTVLGAYLDPLADKALILSSFITLSTLGVIPSWLSVIVISRDCIILVGISILALMDVSFEVKPAFVSKVTTTLQLLTIFLALAFKSLSPDFDLHSHHMDDAIYWLTALFTIASGLNYIAVGMRFINHTPSLRKN